MIDTIYYYLGEEGMFLIICFCTFTIITLLSYLFFRSRFQKRLFEIERKMTVVEKEFSIVRSRNRSNLRTFKKVVHSLDEVIQHIKESIAEEEEKVKVIDEQYENNTPKTQELIDEKV